MSKATTTAITRSASQQVDCQVARAPCCAPSNASADVALVDWDDLFRAVKARLRLAVDDWIAATTEQQLHATAGHLRATVIECVSALDQLHLTLTRAGRRRHQIERRSSTPGMRWRWPAPTWWQRVLARSVRAISPCSTG